MENCIEFKYMFICTPEHYLDVTINTELIIGYYTVFTGKI